MRPEFVVASALAAIGCAGSSRPAMETLVDFRRRTNALISSSGNFQDAARYLRMADYLGEVSAVGRCATFHVQEAQFRAAAERARFVSDANPSYLPRSQLPECRAYRRERLCVRARTTPNCTITDALQVCFHTEVVLDSCKFTRAAWAASFRGSDGPSAAVIDDDAYRAEALALVGTFTGKAS